MGSGFANTLGYDEYYGRTEFDNDEDSMVSGGFGMNHFSSIQNPF